MERDEIALEATLACLLWEALPQANWCGFYRRVGERMLAVGPYQGGMGCLRTPFERGVCGAAARTGQVQLVPDVHAFPGHIACDDATRSELEAIVEEVTTQVNKDAERLNRQGREQLVGAGRARVIALSKDERAAWRSAMQPLWKQYEAEIGADMLRAAQTVNRR